jgi:hypothetical protein
MSTIKSSAEHLTLNADGASKDIKFQANGVEKASIDSSGNLTVSGNLTSVGIDDNADATAITIHSNETVSFTNSVVIPDTINAGSSGSSGGTTGKINFGGVSGSIDGFTITNENGNYLNIKPNSSSNGIKILNSGGMCFGTDTAAANALDDYEEGEYSWTITGSSGGSMTPRTNYTKFSYTKVGRIVTVTGRFETSGTHNATGTLRWSLPFTAENLGDQAGNAAGAFFLFRTGLANVYNPTAIVNDGNNYFIVYYNVISNNELTALDGGNVDSSIEGHISITYVAA